MQTSALPIKIDDKKRDPHIKKERGASGVGVSVSVWGPTSTTHTSARVMSHRSVLTCLKCKHTNVCYALKNSAPSAC
jgi:hypothetical protein